ncbi:MAG TPA: dihydrodipicolinate synthase family protein [Stellaceae bacterium]|nr:dihydrodipicolinate synthase family protein [Stellaceae bacterium]
MAKGTKWQGIFPAITTQFKVDGSVDLQATQSIVRTLVQEGIGGLVACGSVGENVSLSPTEKRDVAVAIKDAAGGAVPVLSGVAEITTDQARLYARDAQRLGLDGLMVMPPMIYGAAAPELLAYFQAVAAASDLPIMLYNNPPAYRNDMAPELVAQLVPIETIVAIKESSGDTRRFVDLYNAIGDRLLLFCGLDDVILEALALGAVGWVSGLSNVFPQECERMFRATLTGRRDEALAIYRWIMPLLHLDARADLVQCIKLCEAMAGRGSERVRPPRLPLAGEARTHVEALMRRAIETRPG